MFFVHLDDNCVWRVENSQVKGTLNKWQAPAYSLNVLLTI